MILAACRELGAAHPIVAIAARLRPLGRVAKVRKLFVYYQELLIDLHQHTTCKLKGITVPMSMAAMSQSYPPPINQTAKQVMISRPTCSACSHNAAKSSAPTAATRQMSPSSPTP